MIKTIKTIGLFALAINGSTALAQSTADFENFSLPADSAMDATNSVAGDTTYQSSNFSFSSGSWGGLYWTSGWAISTKGDTLTAGSGNAHSCISGSGYQSSTFAVGQGGSSVVISGSSEGKVVDGLYVNNTTYATLSMKQGDTFAKKFGGDDGTDPDWFLLTIKGYNNGVMTDSVDFYLADFRADSSSEDYIVTDWQWVDLSSLENVDSLTFGLSSSDVGDFGMNTPSSFAIDNLRSTDQTLSVEYAEVSSVDVFPNPTSGNIQLLIDGSKGNASIQLVSLGGEVVLNEASLGINTVNLDLTSLNSGVYFLNVIQNGAISTQKIIKQ